jgi:4-hydroxybenzoate polyprenyltransferase
LRLRSVYDELVYGGHLLSLGTASIAGTAALMIGVFPSVFLLLMAYLFSNAAYTINRGSEVEQDEVSHPARTAWLKSRRKYLTAIAGAYFLIAYVLAFLRNLYFFVALLVPLGLALLYSVGSGPLGGLKGTKRLKDRLLVKNLAISLGWSLVPFLVGLYYLSLPLALLLLCPFIFMRLFVNTVFFDARDVKADTMYGTKTIPAVYGEKVANLVMIAVDVACFAYIVLISLSGFVPSYSAALAVFPLYSIAYRQLAPHADRNMIRDLVADGEYLLWMPVILIGKI